jgi:hypothetical protein
MSVGFGGAARYQAFQNKATATMSMGSSFSNQFSSKMPSMKGNAGPSMMMGKNSYFSAASVPRVPNMRQFTPS